MKKFMKAALAVMLVLISVTACRPQYVLYDPDLLPGHGGDPTPSVDGNYTVANTPEEFVALIASGTPVKIPTGEDYDLPADLTQPVVIKGTDSTSKITITEPSTSAPDNNSGYNLPAGSKLENITIVFESASAQTVSRSGDPEPQFAMVITGDAATTISNVAFEFPTATSLSGICIWEAGDVSISDVKFTGGVPARAPFNISGSTVKFSGNIDAENGSGWYDDITAIQINGVGSNHTASTVSFDNVTGVDAVWQEVVEASYNEENDIDWKTPSGNGQSSVTGLSGYYRIYSERPAKGDTAATRGWMWASEDYSAEIIPMFFAYPSHDRFFNALNEDLAEDNPAYEKMTNIERPVSLSSSLKYTFGLNGFDYSSSSLMNALATGNNLSITFSGKLSDDGDEVSATNWSMNGTVDLELSVPTIITAKIELSMNNFSGIFADTIQGTEVRTLDFILNGEAENIVWADIAKKVPDSNQNPAFTFATGLTGDLSISGVAVDLDKFMEATKNFNPDDLMKQFGQ